MHDTLSQLASHPDIVPLMFFGGAFVTGIIVWVSLQWRLHRRCEMESSLKQDMLNRGMSAEEIERVIRASSRTEVPVHSCSRRRNYRKPRCAAS